jgi:phosphoribulokinase
MIFRESVVSEAARGVLAAKRRPVAVGIDGPGGSGKSTFARDLADYLEVSVAIVQGDDFYSDMPEEEKAKLSPEGGCESYFDWRRLRTEVLESVRGDVKDLRYQRYDWDNARMGNWIDILMPEVVIVEGVYTLRPQLRDLLDFSVYIRTGEGTRARRLTKRGENSNEWIERWNAASNIYESKVKPWEDADLIIDGE